MAKIVKIPEEAAKVFYEKLEKKSTAKAALMIKLPENMSKDQIKEYYDKAFSTYILAGTDFKKYEESVMEALGVTSYIRIENLDMIIEE